MIPILLFLTLQLSGQIIKLDLNSEKFGWFKGTITISDTSHTKPPVIEPPEPSETNHRTFYDVIGFNGNILLGSKTDGWLDDTLRSKASIFSANRIFVLASHDFVNKNGIKLPFKIKFPEPNMATCPNINSGWGTTNAAWKSRFCIYDNLFKTNFASPELIFNQDGKGNQIYLKYPNKSLTYEEMKSDPYWAGFKYGHYMSKSLEDEIDVIEAWNEPHGEPSIEHHNQWAKGMHDALVKNKSNIRFCTSDRTASGYEFWQEKAKNTRIEDVNINLYTDIQMHAYSFDAKFQLIIPPEVSLFKDNPSVLTKIRDMHSYIEKNNLNHRWHLTEYGYSSYALGGDNDGETIQAAFILRTIAHAMRYGVYTTFVYQLQDEPFEPFKDCGLITKDGHEKVAYKVLKTMVTKFKDYYFEKTILDDGENFSYQFTNGSDYFIMSWSVNDSNLPIFKFKDRN